MTFDFDDLHSGNHKLDRLYELHGLRRDFRCTVFAIPGLCSPEFLDTIPDWIELAVHGWKHPDPYECSQWDRARMERLLDEPIVSKYFVQGFKAPGWQISDACYDVLLERGFWVADQHLEDHRRPAGLRTYFYEDGGWHGHVQDVCGNGIEETWRELRVAVLNAKSFEFASEATTLVERPLVSVLTPSIPSRARMLEECRASVAAQTYGPVEHLVEIDTERHGCAVTMNRLADRARGEWLLPLADDDLLLPGTIAALLARSGNADIVYAPPLVSGTTDTHFFGEPPYIPSFALIHADLWREIGGYDETRIREEDRGFWQAALDADAVFARADEPLWVYRHHGGNKSYNLGVAA